MDKELERWDRILWITRGCRFIASKRMDLHDLWSTLTINIISVYGIGFSLIIYLPNKSDTFNSDMVSILGVTSSVLIMVVSIILSSREYKMKSHKFHNCGMELSILCDRASLLKVNLNALQQADIEALSKDYNDILIKYDLNHDRSDYLLFKSQNLSAIAYQSIRFKPWFRFKAWFSYYVLTLGRYCFFILLPILILWIFF